MPAACSPWHSALRVPCRVRRLRGGVQPFQAALLPRLLTGRLRLAVALRRWDQDGDGTIDRREFEQKVVELGLETDDAHLDALFKRLDGSGDGLLDLDEMKATLTRLRESAYDGAAKLEAQVNQTSQLKKQANGAAEAARTALKEYDEQLTLDDLLLAS